MAEERSGQDIAAAFLMGYAGMGSQYLATIQKNKDREEKKIQEQKKTVQEAKQTKDIETKKMGTKYMTDANTMLTKYNKARSEGDIAVANGLVEQQANINKYYDKFHQQAQTPFDYKMGLKTLTRVTLADGTSEAMVEDYDKNAEYTKDKSGNIGVNVYDPNSEDPDKPTFMSANGTYIQGDAEKRYENTSWTKEGKPTVHTDQASYMKAVNEGGETTVNTKKVPSGSGSDLSIAYKEYKKNGGDKTLEKFKTTEWTNQPEKTRYSVYTTPSGTQFQLDRVTGVRTTIDGGKISSKTPTIAQSDGSIAYADSDGKALLDDNGKIMLKTASTKAQDLTESGAVKESIFNQLGLMMEAVENNPSAVGSVGENPIDWIMNNVNDISKIDSDDRTTRERLDQFSGAISAQLRKLTGETGVMTESDFERYVKMMPNKNDSPKAYANKYKNLVADLKKKYGDQINAFYGDKKETNTTTKEPKNKRKVVNQNGNLFDANTGEYLGKAK